MDRAVADIDLPPPENRVFETRAGVQPYLAWDRAGPDAPLLVAVHANSFSKGTYIPLLSQLARDFRILAPDQRGHGGTTFPAVARKLRSWRIFGRDLTRFLEEVAGEPAYLFGHSLGAVAAMYAAKARPDLVRALVLAEPVTLPYGPHRRIRLAQITGMHDRLNPMSNQARARRARFPDRAAARAAYDGRGAFATWRGEFLDAFVEDGLVEDGEEVKLACAPAWEAAVYSYAPAEIWRLYAQVRPRTLILHGDTEPTVIRPETARRIAKLMPEVELRRVPGTTHFLPMERPDAVIAGLRREMAGLA
jgi:pimeloyl-ACP methyl ester carboxylesterase